MSLVSGTELDETEVEEEEEEEEEGEEEEEMGWADGRDERGDLLVEERRDGVFEGTALQDVPAV